MYADRKRAEGCHGNHVEMQALCELYNRPIEVYQYSTGRFDNVTFSYITEMYQFSTPTSSTDIEVY